ncbi:response to stress-related protein [Apiospora kogelbergensis]|uniref:Response to stress-related protein n=1 Tax=Apiospora kogelbergensis TaxID=1337665 RepID=A0AAW0R6L9_9PEZI
MEVVAVSRSMPKELDLGFMKLKTSMIHDPLVAPEDYIEINEKGVIGNQPAVHDGPVYVFFAEHYDHWCSELGVDRTTWDWCHWGENITLRYNTGSEPRFETQMHLGEVWRIGPDVRLELCGARIPCQKVSWRCGQKDSWLRPLADSGRVGVYMRVLQGGRVHPGNEVVVEKMPPPPAAVDDAEQQRPSVAMISRIAYDAALKTSDTLDLLANHALLLPMNKKFLVAKKIALEDKLSTGKNAWKGWRDLRIVRVVQELADVKSFYLEPVDDAPLANYLPGQFLSVRVPCPPTATTTPAKITSSPKRTSSSTPSEIRSWTISDYVTRDGPAYYRLSIKRGPGRASAWMHDDAAAGAVLQARSPAGRFVLDWSQPVALRPVYVTAGIGLTPVVAMLGAHARHPKFARSPALWVHVARAPADLGPPWRDAVRALPAAVKLERHVFFTGGPLDKKEGTELETALDRLSIDDDGKGECTVHRGRPDRDTLKTILGSSYKWDPLGSGELDVPAKMSPFYVCGPAAFEATVRECLTELGVPPTSIHSESFSPSAANPSGGGELETAKVRFTKSGRTATWSRDKPLSLLELAESLGLAPDYGCRVGACGSCAAKVTCGAVAGAGAVQPDGTVLACSAVPASEVVEIDI